MTISSLAPAGSVTPSTTACCVTSRRQAATEPLWDYLWSSQFWFESFQNWQSEFLAVAAIVVLTIFLRQIGSSQSKAVTAPNSQTGDA